MAVRLLSMRGFPHWEMLNDGAPNVLFVLTLN